MPINSPIQLSDPMPVYCTECGCEVDPAAWLCATCGKNLHEPDAMTTTPLIAPVTSKRSKPDFIIGAEIFAILLIGLFLFLIGIIIWAELYDRV
jgi:hypothetical protein